jgi:adenine deaminase
LIEIIPGELITRKLKIKVEKDTIMDSSPEKDILKLVLADRYSDDPPVCAFVKGFGLQSGAIAASIAHDSHHIIAVGCSDEDIKNAINLIIRNNGGIAFTKEQNSEILKLPYFGLMTHEPGKEVAEKYIKLNQLVLDTGCNINAPFMSLSFLALTVIPELKINHNGLFDVGLFDNIPLFE